MRNETFHYAAIRHYDPLARRQFTSSFALMIIMLSKMPVIEDRGKLYLFTFIWGEFNIYCNLFNSNDESEFFISFVG